MFNVYTYELETFQKDTVVNFRGTIILQLTMLVLCTCFSWPLKISFIQAYQGWTFEIIKN